jgi:F-type H+-transporting ATPase subunit epsilon
MKEFFVQLLTPDKTLFEGEVVRLNCTLDDGGVEILGGHMPSISGIVAGRCVITLADNTRKVFASNDGILNIGRDKVILLSDLLEWEEDLAKAIKEREEHISKEQQRRKQSDLENRLSLVALQRAFAYLKNDKPI